MATLHSALASPPTALAFIGDSFIYLARYVSDAQVVITGCTAKTVHPQPDFSSMPAKLSHITEVDKHKGTDNATTCCSQPSASPIQPSPFPKTQHPARVCSGKMGLPPTCAARIASLMRSTPSYAKHVSSTSARIFSGCGVMRRLMFFINASCTCTPKSGISSQAMHQKRLRILPSPVRCVELLGCVKGCLSPHYLATRAP